jgi:hypothetical protein
VGAGAAALIAAVAVVLALQRSDELRYRFRSSATEPARADVARPELPPLDEIGLELRSLAPAGTFVVYPAALGLNSAARYYAWRTLWPIRAADDTLPLAIAQRFAPDAQRLLVLPKEPPESARAETAALAARFARGSPVRESAHFTAWPFE